MNLVERFKAGLARSREGFLQRLDHLFREGELNEEFYEALEEALIPVSYTHLDVYKRQV